MPHNYKNIATDKMRKAGVNYKFIDTPGTFPLVDTIITEIYKTENGQIAVQRRADTVVDFQKLKEVVGVSALALESGEHQLIGLEIPHFVDDMILQRRGVCGNSGDHTYILMIDAQDLITLNKATIGKFTKMKDNPGMKKRVFSGVRANARPHIGNYLGAIKGMVELQDKFDCIFSVVDLHTVLVPYDPITLQQSIRDVVLDYLGSGLDPQKCHIMIQSQLAAEHLELAYYFGTIYQVSRLEDLPTYKEKKEQYPDYVNMGLLYYPVLMAADILIYNAEVIPTGIDQEPHIEVTREIARKFNNVFGTNFVEPKRFDTPGRSLPSLIGEGKMSKAKGGTILLTDSLEEIKGVLAKVTTDSGKGEKFPDSGPLTNLITFVELFEGHDRAQQYRSMYKEAGIKYGELKAQLAEKIFEELKPIQERRKYYEEHPQEVDQILEDGKNYAQKIARETLEEVRQKMGLV